MHYFKKISEYCKAINIPQPLYPDFDIRNFNENMKTVVQTMDTFRHEFYAVALRKCGTGKAISGGSTEFPDGEVVFFNTPYQLLSWEIAPDWQGYYIMFSQEFLAKSPVLRNLVIDFPFLHIDKSFPISISPHDAEMFFDLFKKIESEYHSVNCDAFQMIETYTRMLLLHIRRLFWSLIDCNEEFCTLNADIVLLSRFQMLIEKCFSIDSTESLDNSPHSVSFYARTLNIHPNHLNAVVKRVTQKTAIQLIHSHIVYMAKSFLIQTSLSIKEIAFHLMFNESTHFNNFFKKSTGLTPQQFRFQKQL